MKIFLTGGSGFVGGAVIAALRERHEIHAMSRSEASDAAIAASGARPVRSALGSVLIDQLRGCAAVIHAAAFVADWGPWSVYRRVNITGTEQLLDAARKAGVRRFVHVGTEAALFHGQHLREVDETYPLALRSPFPYSQTKAWAERAVRRANAPDKGFETIVIRPRFVWGPGDATLAPALKTMVETGRFAWIDGGRALTSTTYIGNLVHGLALALTRGRAGEAYFVLDDGPAVAFKPLITGIMATYGVTMPERSLPGSVARTAAFVLEKTWRLFNLSGAPPLTRFAANLMSRDCILIDRKARMEMGYQPPVPRDAGLAALRASIAAAHG